MTDERLRRNSPEPERGWISRRVCAALGIGTDPPLRRPRVPRMEPVRRSWIGAFWQARIGIRAGMALDDFLRSRLARYLAGLSVPRGRLPLALEVDGGQLSVRAAPTQDAALPEGCEPWLAPLVALQGPAVRQEVAQLEVRLALLEGDIEAARRRTEELSRKLATDVVTGVVAGPPDVEATAEQLGRPPVRSSAVRALALGFTAAALAAEAWQIAQPLLRAIGADPAALGAEAPQRHVELALVSMFALGVAAGLFALAHAGLGACLALFRGDADERRRPWLAAAAMGAALLATLVTSAIAALPPAPGGSQVPPLVLDILLAAVPLAAALVLCAARRETEQRERELAAALAWDRERARALGDRAHRLEELSWAEDATRALERERDAVRRRLRELSARAVAAARIAADAERRERAALARVAHSLVAALELDRYEFVRQASARGALELIAPRRRSAVEPRPAFDEATAPVARVEAGRLAS